MRAFGCAVIVVVDNAASCDKSIFELLKDISWLSNVPKTVFAEPKL